MRECTHLSESIRGRVYEGESPYMKGRVRIWESKSTYKLSTSVQGRVYIKGSVYRKRESILPGLSNLTGAPNLAGEISLEMGEVA